MMLIYACQVNLYSLVYIWVPGCVCSLHMMYTWLPRLNVVFRGSGASLSVLANTLHICFSFAMCRVDISNFSQSQSAKIATSLDER